MNTNLRLAFSLFLLFIASTSFGQKQYVIQDLESWSHLGLDYKLNKKFKLGAEQQFRFQENSSKLQQFFTEVGAEYSPIKALEFGLRYRLISVRDYDNENVAILSNQDRFQLYTGYSHDIGRFDLKYRLAVQRRRDIFIGDAVDRDPTSKFRFRFDLGYNIKDWKWDPEISSEIFRFMKEESKTWDKFRFTIGTSRKFKDIGKLNLFYRIEKELTGTYPQTTYILGAGFTFKLAKNDK